MGGMITKPVNLAFALASLYDIYGPRIVTRMNGHDVKIVHGRARYRRALGPSCSSRRGP